MPRTRVISYKGTGEDAVNMFREDATQLAEEGYRPTSQSWVPGAYGDGLVAVAVLLCLVGIGVLFIAYMIVVKPPGVLTVTYDRSE